MRTMSCLSIGLVFAVGLSTALTAQVPAAEHPRSSPVITAATDGTKVRFSSGAGVCQIRVRVLSPSGVSLFDSAWHDGDVLDWPAASQGQPLTSGSYRCIVTVKDLDGQVTEREATVIAQDGRVSMEPAKGEGLAIMGLDENGPKVTLLAHDGANGAIVSTTGDLSFRFGNFLAGKETERMRLTAEGNLGIGTDKPQAPLDVNGLIRTSGIVFPDGTTLSSAAGLPNASGGSILRRSPNDPNAAGFRSEFRPPILPLAPESKVLRPRTSFSPAYQFVVGDLGVTIGATNPTYRLDVAGPINTSTEYDLAGSRLIGYAGSSLFMGTPATGSHISTGIFNLLVGQGAGSFVTGGSDNAMFGNASGSLTTDGAYNSFFGSHAGDSNRTGSYNTALGWSADITDGLSNATAVGVRAKASQSHTVILGEINGVNNATTTDSTGIATQTPNQYLGVGGGITVDENNTNDGTMKLNGVIAFGTGAGNGLSGEGIGSQRTASGGNQFGLDFYTLYTKRMSIDNGGNVTVVGNLSKGGGSFKIDHPLDPENKYLEHSFVESPDMMDIYNGNAILDDRGEAVVQLPDWFEALNRDFRYQLTCLHGFAPVYIDEEISGNRFKIAGGKPGMKVSWQVTGIRQDPYANAHRIPVEEEKPPAERGKYLHPVEYRQPPERGVAYQR